MKKLFISACVVALCVSCSGEKKDQKPDISIIQPAPSEQTTKKQSKPERKESALEKRLREKGFDSKNATTEDIKKLMDVD